MTPRTARKGISRATQRGMSLFITLIAVVLLTFAGLALLRALNTSTLITGNLQFQEAAIASGNAGTEAAITWLGANSAGPGLFTDVPTNGYYATSRDGCNLTALSSAGATNYVNWLGASLAPSCGMQPVFLPLSASGIASGYTVGYVINRMCNNPGPPGTSPSGTSTCASYSSTGTGTGSTQIGASYGSAPFTQRAQYYYRITTRTTGPRNTVRYTQTFVVI